MHPSFITYHKRIMDIFIQLPFSYFCSVVDYWTLLITKVFTLTQLQATKMIGDWLHFWLICKHLWWHQITIKVITWHILVAIVFITSYTTYIFPVIFSGTFYKASGFNMLLACSLWRMLAKNTGKFWWRNSYVPAFTIC